MLRQKMCQYHRNMSLLTLLSIIVIAIPGPWLLDKFQDYRATVQSESQIQGSLDDQIRALEQNNLQLQLKNEALSQNETEEIQRRLGQLEIEQRLSDGTASLEEQINALKEAEQRREANVTYLGGLTGPDGYYLATHN